MPEGYSRDLCNLLELLMRRAAEKRPSIKEIFAYPLIQQHMEAVVLERCIDTQLPISEKPSSPLKSPPPTQQLFPNGQPVRFLLPIWS